MGDVDLLQGTDVDGGLVEHCRDGGASPPRPLYLGRALGVAAPGVEAVVGIDGAGDVVGGGVMGVAGNSAFLDYVLRIAYGESTVDVRVDDRMYLVSPDVLVNESIMTKFGLRVGSLLLVILKQDGARAATVSE